MTLRTIRQSLKLTQQQLADALGVHRVTVARYERDDKAPPWYRLALEGLAK